VTFIEGKAFTAAPPMVHWLDHPVETHYYAERQVIVIIISVEGVCYHGKTFKKRKL
jgi:hypothetical protein